MGPGANVVEVARDGSCVPRSILLATGKPSGDSAVADLRQRVVSTMRSEMARYLPAVLQGSTMTVSGAAAKSAKDSGNGDDAARFEAHCVRMAQASTFFEEPEFQAAADVLGTEVIVDALVVEVRERAEYLA